MCADTSKLYHHQGELLLLHLFLVQVVQLEVAGGAGGGLHLVGGVEGGEVDLELVVVLAVEHHRLEPVAPQDLVWKVGGSEALIGFLTALRPDFRWRGAKSEYQN